MRRAATRIAFVLLGTALIAVLLVALTLRMHPRASAGWSEFSIGPASGQSASIDSNMMVRSDGLTLKAAVALAYDVPAVRVIGPPRLTATRYSFNAVADDRASESFRSLLKQELKKRLRLQTHVEVRPFDVFVLTAAGAPRLPRADGMRQRVWVQERSAQLEDASLQGLADALQGILGRPVIDETGIAGLYDLELAWDEDRIASVTATLRDRFGLQLSQDRRDMEALIIDGFRRDPALVLLEQIGRVTRVAPPHLRQHIGELFTIH